MEQDKVGYFNKKNIKSIYGVAIIMMIVHHVYGNSELIKYTLLNDSGWIEDKISFWCKICVAVYAFLAGNGVTKMKNLSLKDAYYNIIKRILILYKKYWFVFVIFITLGHLLGFYTFNAVEMITNFFALSSTYNGTWWFLYQYVVMMMISPFLLHFIEEPIKKFYYSIVVILYWSLIYIIPVYMEIEYFYIFIIGILTEKYSIFERIERWSDVYINISFRKYISIFGICLILFLRLLLSVLTGLHFQLDIIFVSPFIALLKPLLNISGDVLYNLGRNSTFIWFTHAFICTYFFKKNLYSLNYSLVILLVMIVTSIFLGYITEKLYNLFQVSITNLIK